MQGKPYTPNLGESENALRSYARAMEIAKPLAAKEHGPPSVARRLLGQAEENMGAVQSRLDRWEESQRSHRRSAAIRRVLSKDDPAHADDWNRGLAANYVGLGDAIVSANRQRPAAGYQHSALNEYRRALPLCERLYIAHPEQALNAILLVKACSRIATELSEIGAEEHEVKAFEESAAFHRGALAVSEAVLRADPTNTSFKHRLADELIATSYLLAQSGSDLPDASRHCQCAGIDRQLGQPRSRQRRGPAGSEFGAFRG